LPDEVEIALGKRFIGRRDVKAVQNSDGSYMPDVTNPNYRKEKQEPNYRAWSMPDLRAHVTGEKSYGHYLVDPSGLVKLFAFDIDLRKEGKIRMLDESILDDFIDCNPREVWVSPDHPGKEYLTVELRCAAEVIARRAYELAEGDLHVAIAYSGGKGLHVYCFPPEPLPASEARDSANHIIRSIHHWDGTNAYELFRGNCFWRPSNSGSQNIDIEVFPKQDSVSEDGFGNLMRLPLGVNRKTGQRSFFLDCRTGYNQLKLMDPLEALGSELPWD
jgi:hypothetical protein